MLRLLPTQGRAASRAAPGPDPNPSPPTDCGGVPSGPLLPTGCGRLKGQPSAWSGRGGGTRTGRVGPCSLLSHAVLRLLPTAAPGPAAPAPPRLSLLPPWPPVTLGAPRLEVPSPVPLPSPAQPPASARCLPLSPRFPSLGPSFSPCLLRPSALSPGPGRSPQQYR